MQTKCGKAVNLLFPINNTPNLDITLIIEQGFNIQIKTIQEIVDETKAKQVHTLEKINYSQLASIGISIQVKFIIYYSITYRVPKKFLFY